MASFRVKAEISGLEEILAAFRALPRALQKRHARRAMNEISRDLLWAARARTPRRRGLLYKSLGRKVKVYPSGVVVAIVGARQGFRQQVGTRKDGRPVYANPTKYLHLVELGTKRSRASGMLREALAQTEPSLRAKIARAISQALAEAKGGRA